jgi:hypothetical protein
MRAKVNVRGLACVPKHAWDGAGDPDIPHAISNYIMHNGVQQNARKHVADECQVLCVHHSTINDNCVCKEWTNAMQACADKNSNAITHGIQTHHPFGRAFRASRAITSLRRELANKQVAYMEIGERATRGDDDAHDL